MVWPDTLTIVICNQVVVCSVQLDGNHTVALTGTLTFETQHSWNIQPTQDSYPAWLTPLLRCHFSTKRY